MAGSSEGSGRTVQSGGGTRAGGRTERVNDFDTAGFGI
jgi:hypothetical protein